MIYVSRRSQIIVLAVVLFGILLATPNFLPAAVRNAIPSWLPNSTVSMGLDLQGGSYLLLEVDLPGVYKEKLETLEGDIRAKFNPAHIGYTNLSMAGDSVRVQLTDPGQADAARKILNDLTASGGVIGFGITARDYDIAEATPGNYALTIS